MMTTYRVTLFMNESLKLLLESCSCWSLLSPSSFLGAHPLAQLCSGCSRYFCQQCISGHSAGVRVGERGGVRVGGGSVVGTAAVLHGRKSPQLCRRCTVFGYTVMERGHLAELSLQELRGYQVGVACGLTPLKPQLWI